MLGLGTVKDRRIATYYARLKVAQDAPPEVIRAAHKALAQKYHPDRHEGSVRHEKVLASLNKAKDVLLDPERRASHDAWIREQEVLMGLRDPWKPVVGEPGEGRWARLRNAVAEAREEGMPLREVWRREFTLGQRRAALILMGVVLALLMSGGLTLWMSESDSLSSLPSLRAPDGQR